MASYTQLQEPPPSLPPQVTDELDTVGRKQDECMAELAAFRADPDETTGHAFVCFQRESTRNRFLAIFNAQP